MTKEERRVGAEGQLRTGQHLRRVPVVGEGQRRDLQVQLHGRAGGLGGEGVEVAFQSLAGGAFDVQVDVLTTGRKHRVVERVVSRVVAHPFPGEILRRDGREDADHDDPVAQFGAGVVGTVERGAQVGLQSEHRVIDKLSRFDVELDVVAGQLRLVLGVGDALQNQGIVHLRPEVRAGQVELDLHPGHRAVEVEVAVGQHPLEDIQAQLHLLTEPLALLARVGDRLDVLAHGRRVCRSARSVRDGWSTGGTPTDLPSGVGARS